MSIIKTSIQQLKLGEITKKDLEVQSGVYRINRKGLH